MCTKDAMTSIRYICEIARTSFSVLFEALGTIIFQNYILIFLNPYSDANSVLDLIPFSTSFKISTFVSYEIASLLHEAMLKINYLTKLRIMITTQFSNFNLMR
jgi:hypothetical protein